ncbi:hypothetical protein EVAR_28434_1 [Eumeta japonica]|uniref:Uncharacterized protein n=1 Tax=Eumeta variegata TaxID=151549 RepID=A0A4C1V8E5_EUMVA|nr:hypothetical protein EVAR_28434_1 [Eumeta japonica]
MIKRALSLFENTLSVGDAVKFRNEIVRKVVRWAFRNLIDYTSAPLARWHVNAVHLCTRPQWRRRAPGSVRPRRNRAPLVTNDCGAR